jgi:hypothetical protein
MISAFVVSAAVSDLHSDRRLAGAVVYQDFLDNIEPDERRYHLHDPLRSLRDAIR